jgi:hypothetical protein
MRRFRYEYGAGPLHLLVAIAGLAVAGYGLYRALELVPPVSFLAWFVGGIVGHDFILLPIYSGIGLAAWAIARLGLVDAPRVAALNHVRVPAAISGLIFVVWFPLILGLGGATFEGATGRTTDGYLERWLAITAGLFAVSAVLYAVRVWRARRSRAGAGRRAPSPPSSSSA